MGRHEGNVKVGMFIRWVWNMGAMDMLGRSRWLEVWEEGDSIWVDLSHEPYHLLLPMTPTQYPRNIHFVIDLMRLPPHVSCYSYRGHG